MGGKNIRRNYVQSGSRRRKKSKSWSRGRPVSAIGQEVLPFCFRGVALNRLDYGNIWTRTAIPCGNVNRQRANGNDDECTGENADNTTTLFSNGCHRKTKTTAIFIHYAGVVFGITEVIRPSS